MAASKMTRWAWTHNGFHGRTRLAIRVPAGSRAGDEVHVSAAVATRLRREVCGSADCRCGEHIADEIAEGDYVLRLPAQGSEQRGNYPQS